ncbi:hypothetical protein C4577_02885 [Candidatus Parcubacteria bacterium]|nr:MAG: hypothetical protein C4577_02885 [Candidatus Parcubacteria bacterium]
MDAEAIADEIQGFLQDAVGDMASGMISFPDMMDDKIKKKFNRAKKEGVRDLQGWLADTIWDDPNSVEDLIGDKICDLTNGDKNIRNEVCKELINSGHRALSIAAKRLLRD